jgi:hypothetical protein
MAKQAVPKKQSALPSRRSEVMIAQEAIDAKSQELDKQVARLKGLIREAIESPMPIHELEENLLGVLLSMGRNCLQILFDLLGPGDIGQTAELPGGGTVSRLEKPHPRPYLSIFGQFELSRFVYGRGEGRKIELIPLDAHLAMPESKFSYLLQSWDQRLATEQPFAQVSETMEAIFGLSQHVDSLERMNRKMARSAGDFMEQQAPPPAQEEGAILVQTADGKGVPMRQPADAPVIASHRSKRGPKPNRKKMATVGAVYSIDPHVRTPEQVVELLFRKPGEPGENNEKERPRPQHKRVRVSLDHLDVEGDTVRGAPAIFGWMTDQVRARNPHDEKPLVTIMDGQRSLWDERDAAPVDTTTIDILDLLHVTPRLWEAAHLFYPPESSQATQFVRKRVLRILQGKSASVVQAMQRMVTIRKLSKKKRAKLDAICNYYRNNEHRMRYDKYLRAGYPIASGVIEGACRHVVKDRMERAGMSWIVPGAQAMLELRCIQIAGAWDEFTSFRIKQETKRLYPYRAALTQVPWLLAA